MFVFRLTQVVYSSGQTVFSRLFDAEIVSIHPFLSGLPATDTVVSNNVGLPLILLRSQR